MKKDTKKKWWATLWLLLGLVCLFFLMLWLGLQGYCSPPQTGWQSALFDGTECLCWLLLFCWPLELLLLWLYPGASERTLVLVWYVPALLTQTGWLALIRF